jgi:hypothetical protein
MIRLIFAERHRQAQLYAAQMRARRAMGDRYAHHPRHSIKSITITLNRRIENAKA